jgi:hypothetical protein
MISKNLFFVKINYHTICRQYKSRLVVSAHLRNSQVTKIDGHEFEVTSILIMCIPIFTKISHMIQERLMGNRKPAVIKLIQQRLREI